MDKDEDTEYDSDGDPMPKKKGGKGNDYRSEITTIFTGKHKKLTNVNPVPADRIIFSQKYGDEIRVANAMYKVAKSMKSVEIEITDADFM